MTLALVIVIEYNDDYDDGGIMAKSPAERQRDYMKRKKQKEARDSVTVANVYHLPFHQFAEDYLDTQGFGFYFHCIGLEPPRFEDDRGPLDYVIDRAAFRDDDIFNGATGSLGRAETMVGSLVSAAVELALCINQYKSAEINARLKELEASDLTDQAARKVAFAEIARLNKMQDQLTKEVRLTFPQWKVTD